MNALKPLYLSYGENFLFFLFYDRLEPAIKPKDWIGGFLFQLVEFSRNHD